MQFEWIFIAVPLLLLGVAVYDLIQKKHAILRNFPIIGHFRYLLEAVGPELRQYIVTSNDEERPFSRDQRSWVYASSKKENNYFGFGTDNDLERTPNYLVLKHAAFPYEAKRPEAERWPLPCAKTLGAWRGRKAAFRPSSIVNVSAMSYGSLSAPAVEALNRGCALADALHNTGEGGVASYHRNGGDLVWQIGTGYFGCRDADGRFSLEQFQRTVASARIRAIEIKLSQGAKPGQGGVLPAAKITKEIAEIRGIPMGRDCLSPARHGAFSGVDEMIEFIETLAEASGGLPVGIKSAVGEMDFWEELASKMAAMQRGPDFITIDGAEGGTGAAPLAYTDHVALPFKIAISRVYPIFVAAGLAEKVVFIGSGRLGFPVHAMLAMALGCDMINVAREAMMAIGCIQAQRCHTDHCPTGVATQNKWLIRGLDPTLKSARLANYLTVLRKEMTELTRSCGQAHPALLTTDHFEILDARFRADTAREVFRYEADWGRPSKEDCEAIRWIMDAGTSSGEEVQSP